MTRRIARPMDGVLHADRGLNRIDLLAEGRRRTFLDAADGPGRSDLTGNVPAPLRASGASVHAGGGGSDAVYRSGTARATTTPPTSWRRM